MSESKVYMFPESGTNGLASMLAPLLLQRGVDPNVLLALNNRDNGFGDEGGWFIWIIFLFFLMGWGRNGNGWGNNGNGDYPIANMLNNDTGRELLMSAIQGNGTAISQLATTLNCDINSIQLAINSVQGQLCQVGNQVGMTGQQVINAIQQGNMQIAQQVSSCCCDLKTQMASCCCDVKDSITRGNYENLISTLNLTNTLTSLLNTINVGQERGFSQLGYATQQLTCDLSNTINSGILKILDGLCAAEKREMTAIINKQNEDLSTYKTAGIISLLIAPINGALAALRAEIDSVKCKLPETKTISDPCHYVPVNTSVNMPFALTYSGCNYPCGFNGLTNAF